jgi:transcriptional regulator with XRE-family HTH domain
MQATPGALNQWGAFQNAVSRLESGRLEPTLPTLARLAKALQVTPQSLL